MISFPILGRMQTQWIEFIQQARNPALDMFFLGLSFFDTTAFYVLLIAAIWFGIHWKTGLKLFWAVILCSFCITILKNFFALPRPFDLMPSLGMIRVKGYGFPSGGAAGSMLLSCLLLTYGKMRYKVPLAVSYVFLVSLSRLYLGVHFVTDVLGGWAVGLAVWALFVTCSGPVERFFTKRPFAVRIISVQLAPLVIAFISPAILGSCLVASGLFATLAFPKLCLPPAKTRVESILRGSLGALIAILLYYMAKYIIRPHTLPMHCLTAYLTGFAIGLVGSLVCHKAPQKLH